MRVRVRGIYATALTALALEAGHEVVGASGPIRDRFADADGVAGGPALPELRLETTADRQGVLASGEPGAVERAEDLLAGVGIDSLVWPVEAPPLAVFDAEVTETLGRGAVCDLGPTEGFLPFDAVDAHVEVGDAVRVQVAEAVPPWIDRRLELDGRLRVRAGVATLVRGGEEVRVAADDDAARELSRMLDLVGVAPPEGWGLRLARSAAGEDAPIDDVRAAVERAGERATELAAALDAAGEVAPLRAVARPVDARVAWFGRASRSALDEQRRTAAPTMTGHHRIKAGADAASAAVDLVEAVCGDGLADAAFPVDAVTRQFGPVEGDRVAIEHGKPDGRLVTLGRGEVIERGADGSLAVRRSMSPGGSYDGLGVAREAGDVALTKVREGRWWYPTVYRGADGERKGTYVNVCTPVECLPDAVRYVDLHVDVVKGPDGRIERLDDDELDAAEAAGRVPPALADRAREVATSIERAL